MPELPEVETVCRGLEPVLKGNMVMRVDQHRGDLRKPFPKNLETVLTGATVTGVSRRAKYILIALDNDFVLILHLGMSGRVLIKDRNYLPQKHDHVVLHMKDGTQIVLNDARRFGMLDLVRSDVLEQHAFFSHLGPEPLSNRFSGPILAAALKGKKTSIKIAIMDQRVVVGVGNIYASEALFLAGIDPQTSVGRVQGEKAEKLAAAIKTVLKKAIQAGGSTLRDHRQANGESGYFQHHFAVYGREGQACPGCECDIGKTKGIRKIVQGGRSSYYCPRKQS